MAVNHWMDQRRFTPFILTVALFFVWMQVAPILFPQFFPAKKPAAPLGNAAPALNDEAAAEVDEKAKPDTGDDAASLIEFPAETITLGEAGFDAGYLIQPVITTTGAAIDSVTLTDPRYTTLDRQEQLKVVGNPINRNIGTGPEPETFQTLVSVIDKKLEARKQSLATVNWEVVERTAEKVKLRYPSPDGSLEVFKTYEVPMVDIKTRETSAAGYQVKITLELKNLSTEAIRTQYTIVGPTGVALENLLNTRLFREIKVGTITNPRYPDSVTANSMLAYDLVKQYRKSLNGGKQVQNWQNPVKYAGVDDQYFAAIILPKAHNTQVDGETKTIENSVSMTRPLLIHASPVNDSHSDMTVTLETPAITIPAQQSQVEEFSAYFGPKRPQLMRQLSAEAIVNLGWFAIVSKFMLWILEFFHGLGASYALSIVLLTVVVRLAMFPLSRKQAIEAEKMRILAPKMKEMQEKHKNQPEEFAKAYREFQKKYNYNPLVGCLPALVQLPIFLGLYNALFHAVDLRLAKFLWIDNLAAPDGLAQLGFRVPWLGWTEFNLLPILTVCLFMIQQKLFMPPAQTDEQRMQFRIMNFMMIGVGFAFYQVPSGLCVYFISSSLWGIIERLLLKKSMALHQQAVAESGADTAPDGTVIEVAKPKQQKESKLAKLKTPSWWQKALAAADEAGGKAEAAKAERKFGKNAGKKNKSPKR